jgi:hypothetical protein
LVCMEAKVKATMETAKLERVNQCSREGNAYNLTHVTYVTHDPKRQTTPAGETNRTNPCERVSEL